MGRPQGSIAWLRRGAVMVTVAWVCSAAASVSAVGGLGVVRDGMCSDASGWQLKLRSVERGVLRVRFLIAGGAVGDEWNIFMDHNDEGFFAGSRISSEDGLVVVRRRVSDLDGPDTIRATAHDTVTGETCGGRITL